MHNQELQYLHARIDHMRSQLQKDFSTITSQITQLQRQIDQLRDAMQHQNSP